VSAEAFTTLDAVLAMNSDLPATRLLKIDTDGYDFRIILASADWLARAQPVLFFEFDPAFSPDGEKCEALEAMEALLKAGYSHFVLYDNFGDFLLSVSERVLEVFTDISVYLSQSRTRVGGIAYLDVCCFGSNDADLFHDVVRSERAGTFQVHLDP
jgi:hypothetical protein